MTFAWLLNLGIGLGYLALREKRQRAVALGLWSPGPGGARQGAAALVLAGLIWGLWSYFFTPPHAFPPQGGGG